MGIGAKVAALETRPVRTPAPARAGYADLRVFVRLAAVFFDPDDDARADAAFFAAGLGLAEDAFLAGAGLADFADFADLVALADVRFGVVPSAVAPAAPPVRPSRAASTLARSAAIRSTTV